jgi:hypothetical protein
LCCGAAGIYSVLHAETSNELGRRKAREIEASGSQLVASANPGCEMQLPTPSRSTGRPSPRPASARGERNTGLPGGLRMRVPSRPEASRRFRSAEVESCPAHW